MRQHNRFNNAASFVCRGAGKAAPSTVDFGALASSAPCRARTCRASSYRSTTCSRGSLFAFLCGIFRQGACMGWLLRRGRFLCKFFGNQLVCEYALLRFLWIELGLLLSNFLFSSLGLSSWPRVSVVGVLARVDWVVSLRLSYFCAQRLQLLHASHVAPLLSF